MILNKYIKAKQNIKITAFGEKKKFATKYQRVRVSPDLAQGQANPGPGPVKMASTWPGSVGRGI